MPTSLTVSIKTQPKRLTYIHLFWVNDRCDARSTEHCRASLLFPVLQCGRFLRFCSASPPSYPHFLPSLGTSLKQARHWMACLRTSYHKKTSHLRAVIPCSIKTRIQGWKGDPTCWLRTGDSNLQLTAALWCKEMREGPAHGQEGKARTSGWGCCCAVSVESWIYLFQNILVKKIFK